MKNRDIVVHFIDGVTSKDKSIGFFKCGDAQSKFNGSVRSIESFISYSNASENTHIGILNEYGNVDSLIALYPLDKILKIIPE